MSNWTQDSIYKNVSSTSEQATGTSWEKVLMAVFMYTNMLVTFFGNLLVLIAVSRERCLQTAFNFFIVNLAITDMTVAATAMSFYATEKMLGYWPFGSFLCVTWVFLDYGMTFASVFTLVAISCDRFWSVFWGLSYRSVNKKKKSIIMIVIVWSTMLILWIPAVAVDRMTNPQPQSICLWDPAHNRHFVLVIAIVGHHGPCVVMLFFYFRVFFYLKKRAKLSPFIKMQSSRREYVVLYYVRASMTVFMSGVDMGINFSLGSTTMCGSHPSLFSVTTAVSVDTERPAQLRPKSPPMKESRDCQLTQETSSQVTDQSVLCTVSLSFIWSSFICTKVTADEDHKPRNLIMRTTRHQLRPSSRPELLSRTNSMSHSCEQDCQPHSSSLSQPRTNSVTYSSEQDCQPHSSSLSRTNSVTHSSQQDCQPHRSSLSRTNSVTCSSEQDYQPHRSSLSRTNSVTYSSEQDCQPHRSSLSRTNSVTYSSEQDYQPHSSSQSRTNSVTHSSQQDCQPQNPIIVRSMLLQVPTLPRCSMPEKWKLGSENSQDEKRARRDMRVFITLTYIIIGYLVCWVPYHFVFDLISIDPDLVPSAVLDITFWLTYINSTINPILYNFSSPEFKHAFRRILFKTRQRATNTSLAIHQTPSV